MPETADQPKTRSRSRGRGVKTEVVADIKVHAAAAPTDAEEPKKSWFGNGSLHNALKKFQENFSYLHYMLIVIGIGFTLSSLQSWTTATLSAVPQAWSSVEGTVRPYWDRKWFPAAEPSVMDASELEGQVTVLQEKFISALLKRLEFKENTEIMRQMQGDISALRDCVEKLLGVKESSGVQDPELNLSVPTDESKVMAQSPVSDEVKTSKAKPKRGSKISSSGGGSSK